jgi:L-ribulose-5-phosphate 3-epimerase
MTQSTNRPMARLSLKWSMIETDLSIADKFALVKDLGFDGVELDAPNDLPLDEVLAARDASGVAIPGVVNSRHWKTPLTDPDPAIRAAAIEATVKAMEDARAYGAETMLLVPGVVTDTTSYAKAYDRMIEGLDQLLPQAEDIGIRIALENVWNDFLLSPLEAAHLVDGFESPWLGWYLDLGNVVRYGRPTDWIEALGPRIFRLDVKEYSTARMNAEGPWKGFDVALGDGDIDWAAINRALAEIGYSGWASVEMPGGGREQLADLKRRLDRIASL